MIQSDACEVEDVDVARSLDAGTLDETFHLNDRQVLRTHTTAALWEVMGGRTPPVRLVTAGRVFRATNEDPTHVRVFHQAEVVQIDEGADAHAMKNAVERLVKTVLGQVEVRGEAADFRFVDEPCEAYVELDSGWSVIAGAGLIPAQRLRAGGYDADCLGGFAIGLGLERIAMHRFGVPDVRDLWRPPHL